MTTILHEKNNLFEFFHNHTKLVMLTINAYIEKCKINSAKKLLPTRIEPEL